MKKIWILMVMTTMFLGNGTNIWGKNHQYSGKENILSPEGKGNNKWISDWGAQDDVSITSAILTFNINTPANPDYTVPVLNSFIISGTGTAGGLEVGPNNVSLTIVPSVELKRQNSGNGNPANFIFTISENSFLNLDRVFSTAGHTLTDITKNGPGTLTLGSAAIVAENFHIDAGMIEFLGSTILQGKLDIRKGSATFKKGAEITHLSLGGYGDYAHLILDAHSGGENEVRGKMLTLSDGMDITINLENGISPVLHFDTLDISGLTGAEDFLIRFTAEEDSLGSPGTFLIIDDYTASPSPMSYEDWEDFFGKIKVDLVKLELSPTEDEKGFKLNAYGLNDDDDDDDETVPEPGTWLMLLAGAAWLGGVAWRRKFSD